jgi:hypothetical protein
MTARKAARRYGAIDERAAAGFATTLLHHGLGHDQSDQSVCCAFADRIANALWSRHRFSAKQMPLCERRVALDAPWPVCCSSSVVEHSLGKGEVESSILSCSTIIFLSKSRPLRHPDHGNIVLIVGSLRLNVAGTSLLLWGKNGAWRSPPVHSWPCVWHSTRRANEKIVIAALCASLRVA